LGDFLYQVLKQTDRRPAAVEHFSQALLLDPFLWSAFEALCDLGEGDQAARLLYGQAAGVEPLETPLACSGPS
jgi:hypothetical protein